MGRPVRPRGFQCGEQILHGDWLPNDPERVFETRVVVLNVFGCDNDDRHSRI